MQFFIDFFRAIGNCFRAFGILFSRGFWPYMFYPLLAWIVLWLLSFYGMLQLSGIIAEWLGGFFELEQIPESGHWLSFAKSYLTGIFSFLIHLILTVLFWFVGGTITKYALLMILSPVFALLSEKTDNYLTGTVFPFSFTQLLRDIFRGIAISLRNLLLELFFISLCFVLTLFFPPLFFITTPLLFFIGWYFAGFALLDYSNERHRLSFRQSIDLIRNNKGYACGIGLVYSVFIALPFIPFSVIGIMLGPAVSVIGATQSHLEMTGRKAG